MHPKNIMQSSENSSPTDGIARLLGILIIGRPTRYQGLAVYPLKTNERLAAIHYFVLDDAIKTGAFRITEVSESGMVPQLRAINETATPVFLLDGEQLVGAKQNRVLNLSLMLAPKSETEIPVACVEAGRWRSESAAFMASEEAYFAQGRALQMEQVSRSLRSSGAARADQRAVWEAVAAKSARMDVRSPTSAASEIYASRREQARSYLEAIPVEADQIGAAYAIGGSLIGIEIFDSETTFRKLSGKLGRSYALDAMEVGNPAEPPDLDATRAFIQSLRSAAQERSATVGMGETVRLSTDAIVGAALEVDGCCVHLSAFRRPGAAGGM
jgi:ARG/rhodanese/phosphatase superfamily protein